MTSYKILLFGPQGSGKGTQGEKLAEYLNIPLIVTGNIFRSNIKEKTELGKKAQTFINKGELVPDSLTIEMIADRLNQSDCVNGFILDGFPRNITQARALEEIVKISHVLLIGINDKESIRRIGGRRACLNCGMTYHKAYKAPKREGICDGCGNELAQRADDTKEALEIRLAIYHKESEPILDKYEQMGLLHRVNGLPSINEVWENVKEIFS
ncbi:MAG: adenylate kinase [Patescibacteria group bacterium]